MSRPGSSSETSPRNLLTRNPATSAWSSRRQQRDRAEEGGEDAAPVDVADDEHGQLGVPRDPHVDDVGPPQVDLGGTARPLADHRVIRAPQLGQASSTTSRAAPAAARRGSRARSSRRPACPSSTTWLLGSPPGLSSTGFISAVGSIRQACACMACARPISAPSARDERVQGHVLRLERRDLHALPHQPPADPGGDDALARVGGGAGDEQPAAARRRPSLRRRPSARRRAAAQATGAGHAEREPADAPRQPCRPLDVLDPTARPAPLSTGPVLDAPPVRQGPARAAPRAPPRTRPPRARRWGSDGGARPRRQARTAPRGVPVRRAAREHGGEPCPGPARRGRPAARRPSRTAGSAGERCPTMASRVLTARKPSSPGTPATAPQTRAPTTASEVFSATDSTTARAIPSASRACGSRPHRCGSRARAASTSPASSARSDGPGLAHERGAADDGPGGGARSARRRRRGSGVRRAAARAPSAAAPPAHTSGVQRAPRLGGPATAPAPRLPRPARTRRPDARGGDRRASRSPRRPAAAPYAWTRSARTRLSRPSGSVRALLAGGPRSGSRAWRNVLTQGVHALVRRDRR